MLFSDIFNLLLIVISHCLLLTLDSFLQSIYFIFISFSFPHSKLFDSFCFSMKLFCPVFSFFCMRGCHSFDLWLEFVLPFLSLFFDHCFSFIKHLLFNFSQLLFVFWLFLCLDSWKLSKMFFFQTFDLRFMLWHQIFNLWLNAFDCDFFNLFSSLLFPFLSVELFTSKYDFSVLFDFNLKAFFNCFDFSVMLMFEIFDLLLQIFNLLDQLLSFNDHRFQLS